MKVCTMIVSPLVGKYRLLLFIFWKELYPRILIVFILFLFINPFKVIMTIQTIYYAFYQLCQSYGESSLSEDPLYRVKLVQKTHIWIQNLSTMQKLLMMDFWC